MTTILDVEIPVKPMGLNHAYPRGKQGVRYLKKEAKLYKTFIAARCRAGLKTYEKFSRYEVQFCFGVSNGLKKNGEIKKKMHDVDGFIKLALDACFESLCIDDAFVTHLTARKKFDGDYINIRVIGFY